MNTKTRLFTLLLALCALLSLAACAEEESDAPDGFVLAENEGSDYLFYYPEDWLLDRSDAGMTAVTVSETDFSNVSVAAFTATGEYQTLTDYVEKFYFQQFEDNFQNLEAERDEEGNLKHSVLKIDGCDAVAFNYSASFGGEEYSFRAWVISRSGYLYTVLYTAKSALFDSHLNYAELIAQNLRFR